MGNRQNLPHSQLTENKPKNKTEHLQKKSSATFTEKNLRGRRQAPPLSPHFSGTRTPACRKKLDPVVNAAATEAYKPRRSRDLELPTKQELYGQKLLLFLSYFLFTVQTDYLRLTRFYDQLDGVTPSLVHEQIIRGGMASADSCYLEGFAERWFLGSSRVDDQVVDQPLVGIDVRNIKAVNHTRHCIRLSMRILQVNRCFVRKLANRYFTPTASCSAFDLVERDRSCGEIGKTQGAFGLARIRSSDFFDVFLQIRNLGCQIKMPNHT